VAGARPDLTLRPLDAADIPELTRIIRTPEVARWWDVAAPWEEPDDVTMLDPALHNRGLGTRAIELLVRHLDPRRTPRRRSGSRMGERLRHR
jgi:hypothetical protein